MDSVDYFSIFVAGGVFILFLYLLIESLNTKFEWPKMMVNTRKIDWDKVKTAKDITYILSRHNLFSNLQVDESEWECFEKFLGDEISQTERVDWDKVNKR